MKTQTSTLMASGVVHVAYSVDVTVDIDDLYASDSYDVWFDDDYNFFLDNVLEGMFEDIESDITSVWSTNLSE